MDPLVMASGKVRPAAGEDVPYLAQVMYDSMLPGVGRGVFDAALEGTGVTPLAFHEALLHANASNWGQLADFVVLDLPEAPRAGAASAYRSNLPDWRPLTGVGFKAVSERLGWSPETGRDFWRRYVQTFGLFGQSPQLFQPADYVVEYVAVNPELRGRGLIRPLLEAHVERARAAGCATIGISAMYGNDPALRAYLKFGFREHARLGPERYGGAFPGMIRLILDL
jgi:GNAT superfamily N-acetyltransferase